MSEPFWAWFQSQERELVQMGPDALRSITAQLKTVLTDPIVELSDAIDGKRDLAIGTGDQRADGAAVTRLLARAPHLDHWQVVSRRTAQGFGFVVDAGNCRIDPKTLSFEPLASDHREGLLGILVMAPDGVDLAALRRVVRPLLDTAIGETDASYIRHIEVSRLGRSDDPIPLLDLPAFVSWHRRNSTAAR